jgi:hypothetical protein
VTAIFIIRSSYQGKDDANAQNASWGRLILGLELCAENIAGLDLGSGQSAIRAARATQGAEVERERMSK